MQSKILWILGLCVPIPTACAPSDPSDPSDPGGLVVVDPPNPAYPVDIGLGDLDYGETVEHVVKLRNLEDRPLTIKRVTPSCSCTVSTIATTAPDGTRTVGNPRREGDLLVLPPGSICELTASVNTRLSPSRNTAKRVLVRIESDSETNPFLTLEIHFTVVFPFQITPAIIDLGHVAMHGGGSGSTDIVPIGDTGDRVLGVLDCPPELDCDLVPVNRLGEDIWSLHVRWLPPLAPGHAKRLVKLQTSGPDGRGEGRPLEIQVRVTGVPDVSASPTRLVFPPAGDARPNLALVEVATKLPGQKLKVRATEILGSAAAALKVLCEPIAPDQHGRAGRLEVQLYLEPTEAPEAFSGVVRLEFEGDELEPLEIQYLRLAPSGSE
jgi:hypothetical protein